MKTTTNSSKNRMLDLAPPIAFYLAYIVSDLITATIVLMVSSVIIIAFNKLVLKKGSKMVYLSTALLGVFGGLTIFSGDVTFIKMKPTIVYSLFSIAILIDLKRKNSFSRDWISRTFSIDDIISRKIILHFSVFWVFLAVLNEIIWRNLDESTWVLLKSFGFTALNMGFCMYCYFRFIQQKSL